MNEKNEKIFEVQDFSVTFTEQQKRFPVVQEVSVFVKKGGCTGIIGESGCGKSVFCQAILGVLPGRKWTSAGKVILKEEEVPVSDDRAMDSFRGKKMSMIVQNPLSAFDPRKTLEEHFLLGIPRKFRKEARKEAAVQLEKMYIEDPENILKSYPFQLSGGMLQRVLIALSLQTQPEFLIADEPTTALDSTVQAEILKLLKEQQKKRNLSVLLVSHDLEVITKMTDMIFVMYAGRILEYGSMETVKQHPSHPYTRGLFASRPSFSKKRLEVMGGSPPGIWEWKDKGCPFAKRCPERREECLKALPPFLEQEEGHLVRCWNRKGTEWKNF